MKRESKMARAARSRLKEFCIVGSQKTIIERRFPIIPNKPTLNKSAPWNQ